MPSDLPLSKTLDPADYKHPQLLPHLKHVDQWKPELEGQHEHRRWEYALALLAIERWWRQAPGSSRFSARGQDVGGSGSPLSALVTEAGAPCGIIDPSHNYPVERTLEKSPRIRVQVVTCVSTIEHVPRAGLGKFLDAVAGLVAPHGLLFLTCDYTGDPSVADTVFPEDVFHFHWMRAQIFNDRSFQWLIDELGRRGLAVFGPSDPTWHGPQVYDYSFAALAMVREESR